MILTDRFVFLHMPKTGGTFVTRNLRRLYDDGADRRSGAPWGNWRRLEKHGRAVDIPEADRDRPIVTCVRNPFDRYVSQFEFGWWKDHPGEFPGIETCPGFPNVAFEDFVTLGLEHWCDRPDVRGSRLGIGWHSAQFIAWNTWAPEEIEAESREGLVARVRTALAPSHFVRTDRLNEDLPAVLVKLGMSAAEVEFIGGTGKILPRKGERRKTVGWRSLFDDGLVDRVLEREWLMFDLFPEFRP